MSTDVRYVAKDFGYDIMDSAVWVAAFPDGPIVHLNSSSFVILGIIADASYPLNRWEIIYELRAIVDGVPEDIDELLKSTLASFLDLGLIEVRQGRPQP